MPSDAGKEGEPRTTLTGKPLDYSHDALTNIMFSDVGFVGGDNAAGANLLPPGYTDKSAVRIPIKLSDIEGEPVKQEKKRGFFRKMSNALSINAKSGDDFKVVTMSRGDYLKYWAKGDDGQFLPNVEEPPEGRREWVRKQLELVAQVEKA